MKLDPKSFNDLPFTHLFKTYISDFGKLESHFETNPFDENRVQKRVDNFKFKGERNKSVQILKELNAQFINLPQVSESLEKLKNDKAVAVVTGQQLTLYGGPLFTVFKILTAISTAASIERKYKRPAGPVFWLADEDHDFKEIAAIGVLQPEDFEKHTLDKELENYPRVAEMKFGKELSSFRESLKSSMIETDFTEELWSLLDSCYKTGHTIGESFAKLVMTLFAKHGLILAGSNSKSAKIFTKDVLKLSVSKAEDLFNSLKKTSDELLNKGFHNQVQVQKSNLFWIDDENVRRKINLENGIWSVDGLDIEWNNAELIQNIDTAPEKFSPNVFLRPVLQDMLLPGIAYVAGPGEVAYYAQMNRFYDTFGLKTPIIIPRFSGTIVESGVDRVLPKLPFSFEEYSKRIEDLESDFIDHSDAPDIEPVFNEWKKQFEKISTSKVNQIAGIDPTLKGSSEKVKAQFYTELDKLKGKVYRALKNQDSIQLQRIRKVKSQLFPNENLQEREIAFIYFMNKYGVNIWDDFPDLLRDENLLKSHNLIHL